MAAKAAPLEALAEAILMLQWCAPFRLQHAGRFASEFAVRANRGDIRGVLKSSSSEMAKRRRTA